MTTVPAPEPLLRLFVALELPPAWLDALRMVQDDLMKTIDPRVRLRWVRPEGIHLTLKFIGEVPASRLAEIEAALMAAVTTAPGLDLHLGHAGTFGDRRAPRVVWVSVDGDVTGLAALAARIDTALAGAGLPRERRPLTPHLTLARVPEGFPPEQRPAFDAAVAAREPRGSSTFRFDAVSLMRSHLGPGGARYERLSSFPAPSRDTPALEDTRA